jgi:hypothetical protein
MAPQPKAPLAAPAPAPAPAAPAAKGGEGIPSLLLGFRATVISVIIGAVLGLLTVGILVGIHYSEKTQRFITITSVVVLIIFAVCMKKLPRGYMFSLLSIAMLMVAVWLGFIANLSPLFKILAGFLALGAGLFKIYFY